MTARIHSTQQNKTQSQQKQNKCDVYHCECVKRVGSILRDYKRWSSNPDSDNKFIDKLDIDSLINDFFHLVIIHEKADDFEHIFNYFNMLNKESCPLAQCQIFRRNYRERCVDKVAKLYENDENAVVKQQILDKIHCFYIHSVDIGHRLTKSDRFLMSDIKCSDSDHSTNISLLSKILGPKNKLYRSIRKQYQTNEYNKFSSLSMNHVNQIQSNKIKQFSFGYKFNYDSSKNDDGISLRIKQKYKNLKEELTQNDDDHEVIGIWQFKTELNKATIYYQSDYCKRMRTEAKQQLNEEYEEDKTYQIQIEMKIYHILAVMIYCNYDKFSTEFSKTYRKINENEKIQSVLNRHSSYYHLGKYLSKCVNIYGTKVSDSTINAFYHGIPEQVLFSMITQEIFVYCPLSTSSNEAVAVSFSNNSGLVVEFGGDMLCDTKYFSCGWISDFGNESEYLFIQTDCKNGLILQNILHTIHSYEYKSILAALRIIDLHYDNEIMTEELCSLSAAIMSDRINLQHEQCELDMYGRSMVDHYFNSKTCLNIHYKQMKAKENYKHLHDLFFEVEFEFININLLNMIFPNLKTIQIGGIRLFQDAMSTIFEHLNEFSTKIQLVELIPYEEKDDDGNILSNEEAVKQYKNSFNEAGFDLYLQYKWKIVIQQHNKALTINDNKSIKTNNVVRNRRFASNFLYNATYQKQYCSSYPFNYWIQCKDNDTLCLDWLSYADLYIPPKYKNLKDELLAHGMEISKINEWSQLAKTKMQEQDIKQIVANCETYLDAICNQPDHPSKFGYKDGEAMRQEDIMVIMINCDEGAFQDGFRKSYRPQDVNEEKKLNEQKDSKDYIEIFKAVKHRHTNYHHFARLLKETVEVYGTKYINGEWERMYHGMPGEILLPGFQWRIFSPLSTSSRISIAKGFAAGDGMILELVPDPNLKYFDCRYFSAFPNELELLFVGGMAGINIMKVFNVYADNVVLKNIDWVHAIRIIESMSNAIFFCKDAADIRKIKKRNWCIDREELGFEDISNELKQTVQEYIDYRLSDESSSSTYSMRVLNAMFDRRKCVLINWESMNQDVREIVDSDGTYIGYNFLKPKICKNKDGVYWIDIERIHKLFPFVTNLVILELTSIESLLLNDILQFIENNNNSQINCFELAITNDPLICTNIETQFQTFQQKFQNIEKIFDENLNTEKIVIRT